MQEGGITLEDTKQYKVDNIGSRIKELRLRHGFSLRRLGEELNVSHVYIHDIERNNRNIGSIEFFDKLCEVFQLKEPEIFYLLEKALIAKNDGLIERYLKYMPMI